MPCRVLASASPIDLATAVERPLESVAFRVTAVLREPDSMFASTSIALNTAAGTPLTTGDATGGNAPVGLLRTAEEVLIAALV